MGFDLGLAASAYQGVKAEQRRLRADEFTKAQHDYAVANMDEHTSRRGQRDNAASLADAQVNARRDLLPEETALAQKRIAAEVRDREFAESTRQQREAAGLVDAETGVITAKNKRGEAELVASWSEERKRANAAEIDASIVGREDARQARISDVWASVYDSNVNGSVTEDQIIDRLNATFYSSLIPEMKGKRIADIERVETPDGGVMQLRDEKGAVLYSVPVPQMKAAYEAKNKAKPEIIKLSDGENAYRPEKDGSLKKLTDNKKSFNPNSGLVGRAGGAGAVLDRFAAALMEDAAAKGRPMTKAEAMTQASNQLKSNPGAWAARALQNDFAYTAERDPAKRREMEAEALEAAKNLSGAGAAKATPTGLDAVSPSSQAVVNESLRGL